MSKGVSPDDLSLDQIQAARIAELEAEINNLKSKLVEMHDNALKTASMGMELEAKLQIAVTALERMTRFKMSGAYQDQGRGSK